MTTQIWIMQMYDVLTKYSKENESVHTLYETGKCFKNDVLSWNEQTWAFKVETVV